MADQEPIITTLSIVGMGRALKAFTTVNLNVWISSGMLRVLTPCCSHFVETEPSGAHYCMLCKHEVYTPELSSPVAVKRNFTPALCENWLSEASPFMAPLDRVLTAAKLYDELLAVPSLQISPRR